MLSRVGEDGPTHQPVEQEAQIRLMEKIKNHDGKNSMLVLRPADVDETTVCWKLAMENTDTPYRPDLLTPERQQPARRNQLRRSSQGSLHRKRL